MDVILTNEIKKKLRQFFNQIDEKIGLKTNKIIQFIQSIYNKEFNYNYYFYSQSKFESNSFHKQINKNNKIQFNNQLDKPNDQISSVQNQPNKTKLSNIEYLQNNNGTSIKQFDNTNTIINNSDMNICSTLPAQTNPIAKHAEMNMLDNLCHEFKEQTGVNEKNIIDNDENPNIEQIKQNKKIRYRIYYYSKIFPNLKQYLNKLIPKFTRKADQNFYKLISDKQLYSRSKIIEQLWNNRLYLILKKINFNDLLIDLEQIDKKLPYVLFLKNNQCLQVHFKVVFQVKTIELEKKIDEKFKIKQIKYILQLQESNDLINDQDIKIINEQIKSIETKISKYNDKFNEKVFLKYHDQDQLLRTNQDQVLSSILKPINSIDYQKLICEELDQSIENSQMTISRFMCLGINKKHTNVNLFNEPSTKKNLEHNFTNIQQDYGPNKISKDINLLELYKIMIKNYKQLFTKAQFQQLKDKLKHFNKVYVYVPVQFFKQTIKKQEDLKQCDSNACNENRNTNRYALNSYNNDRNVIFKHKIKNRM